VDYNRNKLKEYDGVSCIYLFKSDKHKYVGGTKDLYARLKTPKTNYAPTKEEPLQNYTLFLLHLCEDGDELDT
jgi:hypothetical protein